MIYYISMFNDPICIRFLLCILLFITYILKQNTSLEFHMAYCLLYQYLLTYFSVGILNLSLVFPWVNPVIVCLCILITFANQWSLSLMLLGMPNLWQRRQPACCMIIWLETLVYWKMSFQLIIPNLWVCFSKCYSNC